MKNLFFCLLAFSSASSFAQPPGQSFIEEIKKHSDWNRSPVYQYKNVYISGTPERSTLEKFKGQEGETIIDLRTKKEIKNMENKQAKALGLKYYQVSWDEKQPIDGNQLKMIDDLVAQSAGKPVFIHCTNVQRSASWLAYALNQNEGFSLDRALDLAQRAGLQKSAVSKKMKAFLEERASESPVEDETPAPKAKK